MQLVIESRLDRFQEIKPQLNHLTEINLLIQNIQLRYLDYQLPNGGKEFIVIHIELQKF